MEQINGHDFIPSKEKRRLKYKKIRALRRLDYTMEEICREMYRLGQGVSKTTVFFAINGRSKKSVEKQKIKNKLNKLNK